ncbi:MAG: PD-(D/E)XK nuclease family protein [Actinomycetes bacterium]
MTTPSPAAPVPVQVPKSISPSSISQFQSCPLAFRFSYVDRLPQEPSPAASKGTLVHLALEHLMMRPADQRSIANALIDLATARTELASDPDFTGLNLNEEQWGSFYDEAERLVYKYFELEDPSSIRPIGLELRLQANIGRATVRGVIDRLELNEDDELVISDYKTGKAPGPRYQDQRLAGVNLYALMVEEALGKRPVKVQLLYLADPVAIVATTSDQQSRGVANKTQAVWDAIGDACTNVDFRTKPGPLCNWCSFKPFCPEFGGNPQDAIDLLETLK